jgi:Ca2+-binding RTX toxin-like protein
VAYAAAGFSGRGNEAISLSDATVSAATLNTLDGLTTGVIDASSVTTLSGTASAVTTALGSSGISGLGNASLDVLGTAGNDTLIGGGGSDTLVGGSGADRMEGGAGDDTYNVDVVGDILVELSGGGYDRVVTTISWTLTADFEQLSLNGSANLNGTGNAQANRLDGNAGINILDGGDGIDVLEGFAGADTLIGGGGADRFVYRSLADTTGDVISDFSAAQGDTVDLRLIDANTGSAGDQAFTWIGDLSFSGVAGQLRFSGGVLSGDVDGVGGADFSITLTDVATLQASNIWL